jgi:hypothetical protein
MFRQARSPVDGLLSDSTRRLKAMMGALCGAALLVMAALVVAAMVLPLREDLVAPGRQSELAGTAALAGMITAGAMVKSAECPCDILSTTLLALHSLSVHILKCMLYNDFM